MVKKLMVNKLGVPTVLSRLGGRRLAAIGGAAAVIGGIVVTAAPAYADSVTQHCAYDGSYEVCVSLDSTNSFVAANFYNGTGSTQYVSLTLYDGPVHQSQSNNLAAKSWTGFGFYDTSRANTPCATAIVNSISYGVCLNGL